MESCHGANGTSCRDAWRGRRKGAAYDLSLVRLWRGRESLRVRSSLDGVLLHLPHLQQPVRGHQTMTESSTLRTTLDDGALLVAQSLLIGTEDYREGVRAARECPRSRGGS